MYKTLEDVEHVLKEPGMYVGELDRIKTSRWILNNQRDKFILKEINHVPGLEKIFDEVLVNAADQVVDHPGEVTQIKVNINQDKNIITIANNGPGFSIYYNDKLNMWSVEQALTKLRTSGRFDQDRKITGGKHGYGAKLTIIFSKKFRIETVDIETQRKYVQIYSNNRKKISKPTITEGYTGPGYTKITFVPDFTKFDEIDSLDDNTAKLFEKRVYDIAGVTPKSVKVYLNSKKIPINNFIDYAKMYIDSDSSVVCKNINDRWTICIAENDYDTFMHVSFVNGINTYQGGTHVNYITNQLVSKVRKLLSKRKDKDKFADLKPAMIKRNIFLFVNCKIEGAGFNSQTKEQLQTQSRKFGSTCDLSDAFLKDVLNKTDLLNKVNKYVSVKQDLALAKATKGIRKRHVNVPKLDDANWAGTAKSSECVLMLVEGDSAKLFAVQGFTIIGRDKYGVFPLRGKLLNVRDATKEQLRKNKEIINIAKILGLEFGKKYQDTTSLRYKCVLILTDADVDGLHIKGLIINFIDYFWPELGKKANNFIKVFVTPIIKATKGKNIKEFMSSSEYDAWKNNLSASELKRWKIKYYKGLGTWEPPETRNLFKKINTLIQTVSNNGEKDTKIINTTFNKKFADARKELVRKFDPNFVVDYSQKQMSYIDYVRKEWVHFAVDDTVRSIPSIMDGLKPSQRKVIHVVLNKNITDDIKVSELAGLVSKETGYHHGETSLFQTITKLAHDFVGSNNIELLVPAGSFGSRALGGKDSASPRYIFTYLSDITNVIFNKMDLPLLNYINDDGKLVEPVWFVPIIPMVLCNGAKGIGTGFSTTIPNYNPVDIVHNIRRLICGKELINMTPWYRGFRGSINQVGPKNLLIKGQYELKANGVVRITELPIGSWTEPYSDFLNGLIEDKHLVAMKKECTPQHVDFTIKFSKDAFKIFKDKYMADSSSGKLIDVFEEKLKLVTKKSLLNTSNMHLFNANNELKKYETALDIIRDYYPVRLKYYALRREYWLKQWYKELKILKYKIKYIQMYLNDEITIARRKIVEIIKMLQELEFPPLGLKMKDNEQRKYEGYGYLLCMKFISITKEKLDQLRNKHDLKNKQFNELKAKSPKRLWMEDLDQFIESYDKHLKIYEKRHYN